MVIQAVGLMDDLNEEINNYSMRVKEWYGWHFPELAKIVPDNILYARIVKLLKQRNRIASVNLSDILSEELEQLVTKAASLSMGTDVTDEDIEHLVELSTQVIELYEYREELAEYLKNRMFAIAPNLTILLGELVGARLVAHAGSLLNLAKQASSTVQIYGAEKALFSAMKSKTNTPKYGYIYQASIVGQANPKNRGKISRILANKAALGCRVDALGDENTRQIGMEYLSKISQTMVNLEGKTIIPPTTKPQTIYERPAVTQVAATGKAQYDISSDITLEQKVETPQKVETKETEEKKTKKDKKDKKEKKRKRESTELSKEELRKKAKEEKF